jgi:hypothetical protein
VRISPVIASPIAGAFVNESSKIAEQLVNSAARSVADYTWWRSQSVMMLAREINIRG